MRSDCIYVNDALVRRYPALPQTVQVHVGSWNKECKVVKRNSLPPGTLGLSSHAVKGISLPLLTYRIVVRGRHLHLGPVLGLIGFKSGEKLTKLKLDTFKDYFGAYPRTKGLLLLCGADGIDLENRKVRGYYYRPLAAKKHTWVPGTFPMPGALYRRAELSETEYRSLSNAMGPRLFNGYFRGEHFDKWDLWNWLSPNKMLVDHLPDTKLLDSLNSLDEMLSTYGAVYLKPTMENMSKGIIKVTRGAGKYEFLFPQNNKKLKAVSVRGMNEEEASEFIRKRIARTTYIIQQAVDMKKHDRRGIDFRIILQKDESLAWSCTAMIARFGKKDGIITNFTNAGYAMNANETFRKVFRYKESQIKAKRNEILAICLEACKEFEAKGGNYADVGFDVMIDKQGKVWILELNVQPDHRLLLLAKKKRVYQNQIVKPLIYAHALTGFKRASRT
jgi:hypothetical protein